MAGFESYLAASSGRTGVWRILVGLVIIAVFWVSGTVLVLGLWSALKMAGGMDQADAMGQLARIQQSGTVETMVVMLLTFTGVWAGVLIAVKALHGYRFRAVFAPDLRVHWADFARGIALALAFALPGIIIALTVADPVRTDIAFGTWILWLVPLICLIFIQATAEELIFRGYLLQQLAHVTRNPIVWAGIPSVLFGLMHFSPGLPDYGGYYYVAVTFMTGLTLAILVWRSGSLWTAAGVHLTTNVLGLTVIGAEGVLTGTQLWLMPATETGPLFRIDVVSSALMLALVASPLGRVFGNGGREATPEVSAFE